MMKKWLVSLAVIAGMVFFVAGCEKKEPTPGEQVEKTTEQVKEDAEKAAKDVEKAGSEMKEKAGKAVEDLIE